MSKPKVAALERVVAQHGVDPQWHLWTSQCRGHDWMHESGGQLGLQKHFEQLCEQLRTSDGPVKSSLRKIASEVNTALVLIKCLSALVVEKLCSSAVKITRPDSWLQIFLRFPCGTWLRTNLWWLFG